MRRWLLPFIALQVTACVHRIPPNFEPARHVVFVDEDGGMREARDTAQVRITGKPSGPVLDDSVARRSIGELMQRIRESGSDTITFYIHGGLVDHARARSDAGALGAALQTDGHFPLFIAWESGWFPTLADHLKGVRQGQEWSPIGGWLSSPFIVLADLGRGIVRAPLTIVEQAADYCATWHGVFADSVRRARGDHACATFSPQVRAGRANVRRTLNREEAGTTNDSLRITLGEYHSHPARSIGRTTAAWLTAIPKAVVTGPLIDGFGAGTYENARRRTQTMFRQVGDMSYRASVSGYRKPTGAASILMDSLQSLVLGSCAIVTADTSGTAISHRDCRIQLNLVGHSMGAMVIARMLRTWPQLPVRTIYFLGAAATVTEIESSVIPFLLNHRETRFNVGMLHPRIEVAETQWKALDLLPRGSLLEWIDDQLTSPETPLDRTSGKWGNMAAMEYIFPPAVRSRVLLKGFGFRDPRDRANAFLYRGLTRHGSFDDPEFAFWRDETWCVYSGDSCQTIEATAPARR